ncbi:MAG: hypothetical protein R3B06_26760 [Kofleriaceae bacterium]
MARAGSIATLAALTLVGACTAQLTVPGLRTHASSGPDGSSVRPAPAARATTAAVAPDGATPPPGQASAPPPGPRPVEEGPLARGPIGFGRCQNPGTLTARLTSGQTTPTLTAPSNPWDAVDDGVPAALPLGENQGRGASVNGRGGVVGCDAAHDHCLSACTWFVRDPRESQPRIFFARVAHRVTDGTFKVPVGSGSEFQFSAFDQTYVAYRTVPATRRLLVPGRKVAVRERSPVDEAEAFARWTMGDLLRVDEVAGTVQLKGAKDVYPLAATRVVVLTSRGGAQVELTEGLTPADVVVRPDEVFLPR